ncbi:MAG TPA: hypothetical protein VHX61_12490 [Rhizomicrobium sp.]|jgi:hypothetical protein|nr:hypothetical protein [Rhizomicrobium sp.]
MSISATSVSREALAIAALAALAVYALALLSPAIFNDGDTYWHISAGHWMLAHRAVLDHDPFSLARLGKPWETQEWLSEVTMAAAFRAFGWSGVAILTGLAMAAAAALLALYLARRLAPVPCIVVLALGVGCVLPDYLARPHILALPFLTAWIIGLAEAAEAQRAPRWFLLPVMTLWANLHGGFIFGLALMFPLALETVLAAHDRKQMAVKWSLFAAAAVAAALLNPRGVTGLLYPLVLMQVQSLAGVGEWQSLDLHRFTMVEFAAFAAFFFFIWRGVRLPALRLLLLLALFHLSLIHTRYGMLLGIAGAILLAGPLGAALAPAQIRSDPWHPRHRNLALAGFVALVALLAVARISWPVRRSDGPASPISALAAVPPSLASQPVFNNYSFGGLLIFDGIKPLVDSRADFYGDAWLADYWRAVSGDRNTVGRLFRKYGVKWTILQPGDPLVAELDRSRGWHRLFTGRFAVVQAGPGTPIPRPVAVTLR